MYYEEVFKELNRKRVRYLVIGGIALVLHGVVRLTADLDLMLQMGSANLAKFLAVMKTLGYRPRLSIKPGHLLDADKRETWKKEKNMQAFSFTQNKGYRLIDILLDASLDYTLAAKRKKIVRAKGIRIPIVCREDLIKLKTTAGRPQDLADIEALEQLTV